MQRMKTFLRKKSLFIRIVLSYLFVGLLAIGALTAFITHRVSQDMTQESNRSADALIEQSYHTADYLLNSTYHAYSNMFGTADMQSGLYGGEFSTIQLGEIAGTLTEAANSNPLVHSVYLFNFRQEQVFSSLSTARSFEEFYDQDMLRLLERPESYRSGIFIPRRMRFDIYGTTYDMNVISIVYLSTREDKITSGAMVINLDQRKLQEMITGGSGGRAFQSMIVNRNGTVISHSAGAMLNSNLGHQPLVKRIAGSKSSEGSMELLLGGTRSRVFYMKSESLGWTFVGIVDYESLLSQVNELNRYILTVTGTLLAVVAIAGALFTRMIYGPIHRLIRRVRKWPIESKERQSVSEVDLLTGTFSFLESKLQDLEVSLAGYRSAKRQEALRRLTADGGASEAELERMLRGEEIAFRCRHFVVCMLRLDRFEELAVRYRPADMALFKYAIANIAEELGADRFPTVGFEDGEDAVSLIVNVPDVHDRTAEELEAHLRGIQVNVDAFLRLSVTASVGTIAEGLRQIHLSRSVAYNGSRYRLAFGTGSVIPYDVEESRESLDGSHSALLEKQIVDNMKLGDLAKTKGAIQDYIGALRNAPYDEAMLLLAQLLIAVARTARTMAGDEQRIDIGEWSQQLYKWETLGQIEGWLAALCETFVAVRNRQSTQKNVLIVEKIKQYIREHYADPNLTAEALVAVGGLSTNYMRKIFKEISGKSIHVYLNEYRFEKAKELLLTTDEPANKIGEKVGFDNTNYFYVSFKKYSGKTPDHYRKSHASASDSETFGAN